LRRGQRHGGEHGDEGSREQPGQFVHAALYAHFVAHRPQHVVTAQQAEKIRERPQQRGDFFAADVDQAMQERMGGGGAH